MSGQGAVTMLFATQFDSVDLARAALQGICAECFGGDEGRGAEFCLAVTEAVNNAVEHAGAGLITMEVGRTELELKVSVINDGVPFDPSESFAQLSEEEMLNRHEGGYGLYLIRELVDSFAYEYRDARNVWILSKALPPPGA